MINKKEILNSIFFPRKSHLKKSELDHIVSVEEGVGVGVRFYLKSSRFDNIIFFHGNAELAEEYADIAPMYHAQAINLIVVDYRGYGLSDGAPTKENLLSDASKIFNYTLKYLSDKKFNGKKIVMGRSLGSASAWEIASKCDYLLDGCIIESGFCTEIPIFNLWGISPDSIDFELSDGFNSLSKIKEYEKPLLVIHAKLDHIVPFSEGELAYRSAGSENKKILVVESANHNNIIYCIGDEYFKDIRGFIDSL